MSERMPKQMVCNKHGAYTVWLDIKTGQLFNDRTAGGDMGSSNPCPKCHSEMQKAIFGTVLAIALFLVIGLPKIIYGKFGKKGVIIYFACWLGIAIALFSVKEYNAHQAYLAREKQRQEQQAAEIKRQGEELKAKLNADRERAKEVKARKETEEKEAAKMAATWQKIEEIWSESSDEKYSWNDAIKYCSKQGWRLPTNKDWAALKKSLISQSKLYDKFVLEVVEGWWSATKLDNPDEYADVWSPNSSYGFTSDVFFSEGKPNYEKYYVRCIRQASK